MVLWTWKITGWRWWRQTPSDLGKLILVFLSGAAFVSLYKQSNPAFVSLPGYTHDFNTRHYESISEHLDDRKIRILAARRAEELRLKQEAQEHFEKNGYKPRAGNQFIKLNDPTGL